MESTGVSNKLLEWFFDGLLLLINIPVILFAFTFTPASVGDLMYKYSPPVLGVVAPSPHHANRHFLATCLTYLAIIAVVFALDLIVLWILSKLGNVNGTFKASLEYSKGKVSVAAANLLGAFALIAVVILAVMYGLSKFLT